MRTRRLLSLPRGARGTGLAAHGRRRGVSFPIDQRGGAVVDIEEDGVVLPCDRPREDGEDILDEDPDARVVDQAAVDRLKMFAVPGHDLREQFRDLDLHIGRHELEDTAQREPESESTDQHVLAAFLHQSLATRARRAEPQSSSPSCS